MKSKLLKLLPLSTLVLTGCFDSSISQEKFQAHLDEVRANINAENETSKDVHINSKLSIEVYNYKEGEYYSFRYFAIALIIPISYGEYTWKEDGKFYNYHDALINSQDKLTELTEEQFNERMLGRKAEILSKLMEPVNQAQAFINNQGVIISSSQEEGGEETQPESESLYTQFKNTFSKSFEGVYKMTTVATYNKENPNYNTSDGDSKTFKFQFKDLPVRFDKGKNDYYKYSYGNSAFSSPISSSGETSESQAA